MSLPGEVCAVLVTTLVLEGWSNRLAPQHSVLGQVQQPGRPAAACIHTVVASQMQAVAASTCFLPDCTHAGRNNMADIKTSLHLI